MSDFIQVNIRDDPSLVHDPKDRRFIVGVRRELLESDLERGDSSLVRKFFQAMPELETFIDENLSKVQEMVAADVALHHAGISRPNLRTLPVAYECLAARNRLHAYDGLARQQSLRRKTART